MAESFPCFFAHTGFCGFGDNGVEQLASARPGIVPGTEKESRGEDGCRKGMVAFPGQDSCIPVCVWGALADVIIADGGGLDASAQYGLCFGHTPLFGQKAGRLRERARIERIPCANVRSFAIASSPEEGGHGSVDIVACPMEIMLEILGGGFGKFPGENFRHLPPFSRGNTVCLPFAPEPAPQAASFVVAVGSFEMMGPQKALNVRHGGGGNGATRDFHKFAEHLLEFAPVGHDVEILIRLRAGFIGQGEHSREVVPFFEGFRPLDEIGEKGRALVAHAFHPGIVFGHSPFLLLDLASAVFKGGKVVGRSAFPGAFNGHFRLGEAVSGTHRQSGVFFKPPGNGKDGCDGMLAPEGNRT